MTVRSKKYGRDQDFDGNSILNSNLNTCDEQFDLWDVQEMDMFHLVTIARYPFTFEKLGIQTSAESMTVTVAINGTPITGINEVSGSSSIQDYTATALNTVAIGDLVTLTINSVSNVSSLTSINYQYKRT